MVSLSHAESSLLGLIPAYQSHKHNDKLLNKQAPYVTFL